VDYFRPTDLKDAVDWLADNDARIAAGCTDIYPAEAGPSLGGAVLDITAIAGLRGISEEADHWRLGGATTWTDIIRADLPPAFDGLKQAAREVGSVQIQNAGTIGGNICNASPAADGVPCLLTLDAEIEVTSKTGRRRLALDEFLLGPRETALKPGEVLSAIVIPKSAASGHSAFVKLGARKYLVISIAMVAVRLTEAGGKIETAAVAVGACSAKAQRNADVERELIGQPWDAELAAEISDELVASSLTPITDTRAEAGYRSHAAAELVRRAVRAVVA
jgi:CO/xanthine dehydrogenase FAD-binding subunit